MPLPWETPAIYPRVITITRPTTSTAVGNIGYSALLPTNETTILSNIPASIQYDTRGSRPSPDLPGDQVARGSWKIFIPETSAGQGVVKDNDVVTDDEGIRYQVMMAVWDVLGCSLRCERMAV